MKLQSQEQKNQLKKRHALTWRFIARRTQYFAVDQANALILHGAHRWRRQRTNGSPVGRRGAVRVRARDKRMPAVDQAPAVDATAAVQRQMNVVARIAVHRRVHHTGAVATDSNAVFSVTDNTINWYNTQNGTEPNTHAQAGTPSHRTAIDQRRQRSAAIRLTFRQKTPAPHPLP